MIHLDRYKVERGDLDEQDWTYRATTKFRHDVQLPNYEPETMGWMTVSSTRYVPTRTVYFQTDNFDMEFLALSVPHWMRRSQWTARVPLWFVIAIFALLPLIWEIRYRRRLSTGKRARRGFCAQCGYDLRATPQQCPECGPVPRKDRLWPWNADYFWK